MSAVNRTSSSSSRVCASIFFLPNSLPSRATKPPRVFARPALYAAVRVGVRRRLGQLGSRCGRGLGLGRLRRRLARRRGDAAGVLLDRLVGGRSRAARARSRGDARGSSPTRARSTSMIERDARRSRPRARSALSAWRAHSTSRKPASARRGTLVPESRGRRGRRRARARLRRRAAGRNRPPRRSR